MKRSVDETRFQMVENTAQQAKVQIAEIAGGESWLDRIKSGVTIYDLAGGAMTTQKPPEHTLVYAFLAPALVRYFLAGKQPIGLTTTWIATHAIPDAWDEQRALAATL